MSEFRSDKRYKFIDEDNITWYATKNDDYKPDRKAFVEKRFEEEFGEFHDYNKVTNLVSRSEALQEWYARVIEDYILEVDVPQYFKELITPEKYKELSEKVSEYNVNNRNESAELTTCAEKYKEKVKAIKDKYKPKFDALNKDALVRILTLDSSKLPLGLQLQLDNYTPSDESDPKTASIVAREMLIRYKIDLLERHSKGEDVISYIHDNQTKF